VGRLVEEKKFSGKTPSAGAGANLASGAALSLGVVRSGGSIFTSLIVMRVVPDLNYSSGCFRITARILLRQTSARQQRALLVLPGKLSFALKDPAFDPE
jgi:hypothetical protein